jgi:hypothetical protein
LNVSITELRQKLFQLADAVIATGEPLLIERKGVRLKLMRADSALVEGHSGRLARLRPQSLVNGPPLRADESPAVWSENVALDVAEQSAPYGAKTRPKAPRNRPNDA